MSFQALSKQIAGCSKCSRLRNHCHEIAKEKRRAFKEQTYWGKPVSGFGDPHAKLMMVGLAPAAHGANRTGRVFTGDRSGEWLYRALFQTGFSNQPLSENKSDGLELNGAYVSCIVRCAPPGNKPTPKEISQCRHYLETEISFLSQVQVFIALGQIAFHSLWKILEPLKPVPKFRHGVNILLSQKKHLLLSYHPSQQNTFTGRLTQEMFLERFETAKELIRAYF